MLSKQKHTYSTNILLYIHIIFNTFHGIQWWTLNLISLLYQPNRYLRRRKSSGHFRCVCIFYLITRLIFYFKSITNERITLSLKPPAGRCMEMVHLNSLHSNVYQSIDLKFDYFYSLVRYKKKIIKIFFNLINVISVKNNFSECEFFLAKQFPLKWQNNKYCEKKTNYFGVI